METILSKINCFYNRFSIQMPNGTIKRLYSNYLSSASNKDRKRFYKEVRVVMSNCNESQSSDLSKPNKNYEINLDNRKLRTPGRNVFSVNNDMLANMIAFEWHSQSSTIKPNTMHLTSLLNTCIDNPTKATIDKIIENINDYLQTDTLLYFDSSNIKKLDELQETKWRPLVDWFNKRFNDINLTIQRDITLLNEKLNDEIHQNQLLNAKLTNHKYSNSFDKYLRTCFDFNSLVAFNYMCECLKSVIIPVALLERHISSVEEAVSLACLEQLHQYDQWGKVEWYHDINENELRSRVSASLLFIYLSDASKYLFVHESKSKI
jgi:ATP synthase mitochondrial F1 complex assembly factor 2